MSVNENNPIIGVLLGIDSVFGGTLKHWAVKMGQKRTSAAKAAVRTKLYGTAKAVP